MKLKVGDIEMDSADGIAIGDDVEVSSSRKRSLQQRHPRDKSAGGQKSNAYSSLQQLLPDLPSVAYSIGSITATVVAISLVAGAFFAAETVVLSAVLLCPVPGFLLFAWLCWVRRRGSSDDDERVRQLVSLLSNRRAGATVAELVKELGWDEDEVILALKAATEQSLIVEDLDVETERWFYQVPEQAATDPGRHALPLEERVRQIESEEERANNKRNRGEKK